MEYLDAALSVFSAEETIQARVVEMQKRFHEKKVREGGQGDAVVISPTIVSMPSFKRSLKDPTADQALKKQKLDTVATSAAPPIEQEPRGPAQIQTQDPNSFVVRAQTTMVQTGSNKTPSSSQSSGNFDLVCPKVDLTFSRPSSSNAVFQDLVQKFAIRLAGHVSREDIVVPDIPIELEAMVNASSSDSAKLFARDCAIEKGFAKLKQHLKQYNELQQKTKEMTKFQASLNETVEQVKKLTDEKNIINNQLTALHEENEKLLGQNKNLSTKISNLEKVNATVVEDLKSKDGQISNLPTSMGEMITKREHDAILQKRTAELMYDAYKSCKEEGFTPHFGFLMEIAEKSCQEFENRWLAAVAAQKELKRLESLMAVGGSSQGSGTPVIDKSSSEMGNKVVEQPKDNSSIKPTNVMEANPAV